MLCCFVQRRPSAGFLVRESAGPAVLWLTSVPCCAQEDLVQVLRSDGRRQAAQRALRQKREVQTQSQDDELKTEEPSASQRGQPAGAGKGNTHPYIPLADAAPQTPAAAAQPSGPSPLTSPPGLQTASSGTVPVSVPSSSMPISSVPINTLASPVLPHAVSEPSPVSLLSVPSLDLALSDVSPVLAQTLEALQDFEAPQLDTL